jgi:putative peptide zinc metalloprotease protein
VCLVAPAERFEALLAVEQSDIDFIRPGARVQVCLDAAPGADYRGQITQISRGELGSSSAALSARTGGDLPTHTSSAGEEVPWATYYQALAPLETADPLVRPGLRGAARVRAGYLTLLQRVLRYGQQTFRVGR